MYYTFSQFLHTSETLSRCRKYPSSEKTRIVYADPFFPSLLHPPIPFFFAGGDKKVNLGGWTDKLVLLLSSELRSLYPRKSLISALFCGSRELSRNVIKNLCCKE